MCICTAARAALKRKKQHEHTLDQTLAQISTLEQQIYSIEAANINRETLAAMEKAGQAMKQIHGKLNIDVVDQTMYAYIPLLIFHGDLLFCFGCWWTGTDNYTGRTLGNNMLSARRLQMPSRIPRLARRLMSRSWMMSWRRWSRSSWMIRC